MGGCPSLEGGFVELLAISEGWNTFLGGRSSEKQLTDHDHIDLEVVKLPLGARIQSSTDTVMGEKNNSICYPTLICVLVDDEYRYRT